MEGTVLTFLELFELSQKQFINKEDFQKISGCGRDKSREELKKLRKKPEIVNYHVPVSKEILVPTQLVFEHFKFDINFIFEQAKRQIEMNQLLKGECK